MLTGGGAMYLNDAFGRNKKFNKIFMHHEQACAMASEAYFRLTGKPCVLQVTTGPGGINALNGVYGAFVDSVPIIVVSGQVRRDNIAKTHSRDLRQFGDQESNIIDMVKPITKYSKTIMRAKDVGPSLKRAFSLSITGRPGPVWIDVPIDIQGAESNFKKFYNLSNLKKEFPKNKLSSSNLKEIKSSLKISKRPIVIAGNGIRFSGQRDNFIKLIERLNLPVATVWNSHDLISNSHKNYAGRPGADGERAGNFNVQNADLIIIMGARMHIRQVGFNYNSFGREAKKIMIDIDRIEMEKPSLKIDVKIRADLGIAIPQLLREFPRKIKNTEHIKFNNWCKERVRRYPVLLPSHLKSELNTVNPYYFLNELFNILNKNSVVVTGDGTAAVITFKVARIKDGQRVFTNKGCASMGYDIPASIGAYLGSNKKVVCITGDGSMMLNIQELQTIAGNNYPIKIFILNNGGYHSIRQTQNNYFDGYEIGCGPKSGLTFPNFRDLSKGFGIPYMNIKNKYKIGEKIRKFLQSKGPGICEVFIDKEQFFEPRVSSKRLPNGSLVSMPLEDMAPFLTRDEFNRNMIIKIAKESKEV